MTGHLRTIVAGIATLERDDPVLATSIHPAERTGAALHLVHAYLANAETPDWSLGAWMGGAFRRCPQARLIESQLQAHVEVVRTGIPVECIGRRGVPRFFPGIVAETVLRKAPCSALVIPPAAVRSGGGERESWMAEPAPGPEPLAEVR